MRTIAESKPPRGVSVYHRSSRAEPEHHGVDFKNRLGHFGGSLGRVPRRSIHPASPPGSLLSASFQFSVHLDLGAQSLSVVSTLTWINSETLPSGYSVVTLEAHRHINEARRRVRAQDYFQRNDVDNHVPLSIYGNETSRASGRIEAVLNVQTWTSLDCLTSLVFH